MGQTAGARARTLITGTPGQASRRRPRGASPLGWGLGAAALVATVWLDRWAYHHLHAGKEAVEPQAWYQVIRAVGTLYWWIPVGLAAGLARPGAWRRRVRAALWVFFAALVSGLAAELLKVLVGRERPLLHDGSYVFRPLTGWLDNAGLSFPSSHAAVAFGGAWMVWRLARLEGGPWRGWAWVCLALASACGVSRMLTGAHFLGDVIGSAIVGAAAALLVHRLIWPGLARRWPEVCLLRRRGIARPAAITAR